VTNDEHIIETLGRTRVVIRGGRVVEIGRPMIAECPLAKKFAKPVVEITPEAIRENVEGRMSSYGACTRERSVLSDQDFVTFGASELISCGLRRGLLDCAVIAADCAGTVVTPNPRLVQGIGGRMSGLVSTSPIREVIGRIESNGGRVLDPVAATIDQPGGVRLAKGLGYSRVAVTVAGPGDAEEIRRKYPDSLIFGVHLTGISEGEAERLVAAADLVSACASKWIREAAGKVALLQAGSVVPVFALTGRGKELVAERIKEAPQRMLVKVGKLPLSDGSPLPLV